MWFSGARVHTSGWSSGLKMLPMVVLNDVVKNFLSYHANLIFWFLHFQLVASQAVLTFLRVWVEEYKKCSEPFFRALSAIRKCVESAAPK